MDLRYPEHFLEMFSGIDGWFVDVALSSGRIKSISDSSAGHLPGLRPHRSVNVSCLHSERRGTIHGCDLFYRSDTGLYYQQACAASLLLPFSSTSKKIDSTITCHYTPTPTFISYWTNYDTLRLLPSAGTPPPPSPLASCETEASVQRGTQRVYESIDMPTAALQSSTRSQVSSFHIDGASISTVWVVPKWLMRVDANNSEL